MALINCPECNGNLSDKAVVCPHCGYPVRPEKEPAEIEYQLAKTQTSSSAATYLYVLAWIQWIGGLIAAIGLSIVNGYRGISFNFQNFFILASGFGISGGLTWAVSLFFEDVHGIHDMLYTLQLIKKEKTPRVSAAASKPANAPAPTPGKSAVSTFLSQWKCGHCGAYNSSEKIFCANCGKTKLSTPEQTAAKNNSAPDGRVIRRRAAAHAASGENVSQWKCKYCEALNSSEKITCSACGKEK